MRLSKAVAGLACLTLLHGCSGGSKSVSQSPYLISGLAPTTSFTGRAATINSSGQVASTMRQLGGDNTTARAFLYGNSTLLPLDTLGGAKSYGNGINAAGQIVGGSDLADGVSFHAFLYNSGAFTDLGVLGGSMSYATAINSAGQIVGQSSTTQDNSITHAFLYQNGKMTDLGTLPGDSSSIASDINDAGQVVGASMNADGVHVHAFLYSQGKMTDLGTLGGAYTYALGINQQGQIVGVSTLTPNSSIAGYAFLYQNGKMISLGTDGKALASKALAINNKGQIVGRLIGEPLGQYDHAFLYQNGKMVDLNTQIDNYSADGSAGWVLLTATNINDQGQIVGWGIYKGLGEIFLLNPR